MIKENKIIIALDTNNLEKAINVVSNINSNIIKHVISVSKKLTNSNFLISSLK